MNDKIIKIFIYLTILSAPLYLVKLNIFWLPTNILEILIVLTFITFSISKKINYLEAYKQNKIYFWSIILIIIGLFASTLTNKNYLAGFGIIKSWFILPIIFGFIVYYWSKKENETEHILDSLYFSAFFVSLISLGYLFLEKLTYDFRLKAFYLSPNYLAMFLAPSVFIGLYFIIKKRNRMFYFISLFPILISLYFTYSYGTWISIILSLFLALFLKWKKLWKIIAITFTIAALAFVSQINNSKFLDNIKLEERSSLSSRLMIYQSSLKILGDNFFWGIGPGNFQTKYLDYQKYFPPYLEWAVPQPHNLYLAFWLESGFLGFLGLFLIIFFWLKQTFENLKQKNRPIESALFISFLFFTLIYGFFDTPYWKNDLSLLFWIFFALSLSDSTHKSIR